MRPARNFNSCVSSTLSLVQSLPTLLFILDFSRGYVARVHALAGVLFIQRRPLPFGMRSGHGFMCDRLALFSRFSTTGWAFKVHCVQHAYSLRRLRTASLGRQHESAWTRDHAASRIGTSKREISLNGRFHPHSLAFAFPSYAAAAQELTSGVTASPQLAPILHLAGSCSRYTGRQQKANVVKLWVHLL